MGVDARIYLPAWVRAQDVADVVARLMGCPAVPKRFSGDSQPALQFREHPVRQGEVTLVDPRVVLDPSEKSSQKKMPIRRPATCSVWEEFSGRPPPPPSTM